MLGKPEINAGIVRRALVVLVCLVPMTAFAGLYGGSWNNALLLNKDRIDTARSVLGYCENLDLFAKKVKGTDLSVFSNINYTKDFASPDRKDFEVIHLYADWVSPGKALDLRAGRQRSFEGNTPVYFDGVKARGNMGKKVVLTAAGGVKVPSRYSSEFINHNADSGVVDLMVRGDYKLVNGRTGLIYQHDVKSFKTSGQDIGAFVSKEVGEKLYGRGNLVFDLFEKKLRTLQLLSAYQYSEKLSLDAEVSREDFKIDSSSVFEKKVFDAYNQASLNSGYVFSGHLSVSAGYLIRRFEAEKKLAHEITARLNLYALSLGLRQDLGFGGNATQADAGFCLWRTSLIRADINAGMIRYQYPAPGDQAQFAYSGGLSFDLGPNLSFWDVKLDGQALRDRYYQYDMRIFLSTAIRFSKFQK